MAQRVLFICTKNAVRSPMAEVLAKAMEAAGQIGPIQAASAGIDPGDVDGFAIAAMAEVGQDLMHHEAQGLDAFEAGDFDLAITLSPEAAQAASQKFEESQLEAWDVGDPSLIEGNRDQRLDAYRGVREALAQKIRQRFAL